MNDITLDQAELGRRALTNFRKRQGRYRSLARALTRNPKVQIHPTSGAPRTDGLDNIWLRVSTALAHEPKHGDPSKCHRRDQDHILICPACKLDESIDIDLYHEIAHQTEDSFAALDMHDLAKITERAINLLPGADRAGTRAAKLKARLDDEGAKAPNYVRLAKLVSPYMPDMLNALEDTRVNRLMMEARPGLVDGFKGTTQEIFRDGPGDDRTWAADVPANLQALMAVMCIAEGHEYRKWLDPEVCDTLDDQPLRNLIDELNQTTTIREVFAICFPVLERLRELGFFIDESDPEDDPPEPPPMPSSSQDDDSDMSGSGNPDNEGDTDEDQDPSDGEQSDGDSDDESQSDTASDQAGDPSSDADDGDAGDDVAESSSGGGDPAEDEAGDVSPEDSSGDDDGDSSGSPGGPGDDSASGDDDGAEQGDPGSDGDGEADSEADSGGDEGDPSEGEDGSGDEPGDADAADDGAGDGAEGEAPDQGSEPDASDDAGDGESDPGGEPGAGDGTGDPGDAGLGDESGEQDPGKAGDGSPADGSDGVSQPYSGDLDMGSPEDLRQDLDTFTGHNDDGSSALAPSVPSGMDEEQQELVIKLAILQKDFDSPSLDVGGLETFRHGDDDASAWSRSDSKHMPDIEVSELILGPAVRDLRLVFTDNRRHKVERNLKRGRRIDGKVLARRVPFNDPRVFHKRSIPGKKDYFVLIVIDMSSSTEFGSGDGRQAPGSVRQGIKTAAFAKAEMLDRIGIPFALYAHTAGGPLGAVQLYEIKSADEPWGREQREALRTIHGAGYNLDGHAIEQCRKMLEVRRELVKILMYYSDGEMPMSNYDEELELLQRNIELMKRQRIHVLGVGWQTNSPTEHGLDTVRVDSVDDVGLVVKKLRQELEHG